ncbi:MAG: hypothetical protein ACTS5F_02100 [Candidatus Hodgkinia cicadicola]
MKLMGRLRGSWIKRSKTFHLRWSLSLVWEEIVKVWEKLRLTNVESNVNWKLEMISFQHNVEDNRRSEVVKWAEEAEV